MGTAVNCSNPPSSAKSEDTVCSCRGPGGGGEKARNSCSRSTSQGCWVVTISERHKNLQLSSTVCGFIIILCFPLQLVLETRWKRQISCPCWQYGRLLGGPWGLSCKVLVRMGMLVIKYRQSSSGRKEVETLWLEKRGKTETLWLAKVRKLGDRKGKWSHGLRESCFPAVCDDWVINPYIFGLSGFCSLPFLLWVRITTTPLAFCSHHSLRSLPLVKFFLLMKHYRLARGLQRSLDHTQEKLWLQWSMRRK